MQPRLMNLPILTTRQFYLFWGGRYIFRRTSRRMCNMPFSCRQTPQLQNYSNLWMTTYQESCTGHFALLYARTECLPWLDGILVFTILVKVVTSECESTHCVIHREVFASWKMSPELNVLQEVMKIINDIKVRALTHVCSCSSVRKWMHSTNVFSYTQKWDSCLNVDHWPAVLSCESYSRDFFQKSSHHWQHILVTQKVSKNILTCVTHSTCSVNSVWHFRGEWLLFKSPGKVAAFRAKLELCRRWMNTGNFDMFQILAEIWKVARSGSSFSQLLLLLLSRFSRVRLCVTP